MSPHDPVPLDSPILAVAGPTASGKSALAMELAQRFGGEIISTDSMQVYRYLDIGTAKPGRAERERVPHHLIDVVDPDQTFSAAAYVEAARDVLADLSRRGRLPILCGGTGLYFRALIKGMASIPGIPAAVREAVQDHVRQVGLAAAHAELAAADPVSASRIHPNDRQRIPRALEVLRATGRPLSAFVADSPFGRAPLPVLTVAFRWERTVLWERIQERVRAMLAADWAGEVRSLLQRGYSPGLKPLQSIGYGEMVEHLSGRRNWNTLERDIAVRTRQYAKRQMTWFRADPSILWVQPGQERGLYSRVEAFLQQGGRNASPFFEGP